mmetsp:Transcript_2614/g.6615  ORF Transcript_2614/g.6615 Transcript_2614/m.6615 type:complete len:356 (+) Transcript_2614:1304-2371(+)
MLVELHHRWKARFIALSLSLMTMMAQNELHGMFQMGHALFQPCQRVPRFFWLSWLFSVFPFDGWVRHVILLLLLLQAASGGLLCHVWRGIHVNDGDGVHPRDGLELLLLLWSRRRPSSLIGGRLVVVVVVLWFFLFQQRHVTSTTKAGRFRRPQSGGNFQVMTIVIVTTTMTLEIKMNGIQHLSVVAKHFPFSIGHPQLLLVHKQTSVVQGQQMELLLLFRTIVAAAAVHLDRRQTVSLGRAKASIAMQIKGRFGHGLQLLVQKLQHGAHRVGLRLDRVDAESLSVVGGIAPVTLRMGHTHRRHVANGLLRGDRESLDDAQQRVIVVVVVQGGLLVPSSISLDGNNGGIGTVGKR